MISPEFFYSELQQAGVEFFAGVPDSLLKNLCAYITDHTDNRHHIIAANEGGAIGLAAGYHLATGKIPLVYMQNSGEGNVVNPLASLMDPDVYKMPVLLVIGWRGEPGVHDEPQHVKQGKITCSLLETLEIPYSVLEQDEAIAKQQLSDAMETLTASNAPVAIVIRKGTFSDYKLQNQTGNGMSLSREHAIETVVQVLPENSCVVSTTGMISRELFEIREHKGQGHQYDFLTVGSMGHASQIALGIALMKPQVRVFCFDGDGAAIMHMGGLAIIADKAPNNYVHIVFNNGAHDSVGGQPTVGLSINLCEVAKAVGYKKVFLAENEQQLLSAIQSVKSAEGPVLVEVRVAKGNRPDLGRPTTTPQQNKESLMTFLKTV